MKDRDIEGLMPIDLLADALVDDIMNTSDEEILSEFISDGGDPEVNAEEMRELFRRSVLVMNKERMVKAKAGAIADQNESKRAYPMPVSNISEARSLLHTLLSRPDVPENFTLAARNENELSEEDVFGMLSDLSELGILIPGEGKGE